MVDVKLQKLLEHKMMLHCRVFVGQKVYAR